MPSTTSPAPSWSGSGAGGPVLVPAAGPDRPMASMPGVGLRPGPVRHYRQQAAGGSSPLGDGFTVAPQTVYELAVFPDLEHDPTSNESPDPNHDGCALAVEFVLADSGDGPEHVTLLDQHRHPVDGSVQCLVGDNWNLLQLDLAPLAGREVVEVRLAAEPGRVGSGWVQVFGAVPAPVEASEPVDRVRTTRGTHSAFYYSRGNTLPQASVPQGAHFLTPLTEARDRNWLYGYHRDGGPHPRIEAFAFNHAPSPWIADRSAFQVMPWQGHMSASPKKRARTFSHDDESDLAHGYAVRLDGGITAEMAPTSHAAVFRFTFGSDEQHGVVLDQPFLGHIECEQLPDGRVAFRASIAPDVGWNGGKLRPKPPAYVYGETSVPATVHHAWENRSPLDRVSFRGKRVQQSVLGKLVVPLPRPQAAVLRCEAPVVEVRAAMSFVGVDQARRNLELEVGQAGFDEVLAGARAQWADLLDRLEVDGGTLDQRTTAWSNLARLYSWPNAHHENVGTAEEPRWAYASPYRPMQGIHTPRATGCAIVPGQLLVNNGYWDTFRTCWPLYSLLTPQLAPSFLSGILQQYRDGGWMARWAAPGYVDCMPGTSSDVVFADASLAGTFASLDDELAAYDSAIRNASVPSDDPAAGRKGIGKGRFVGWIDTDTDEGLAWSVDSAMEDAAISLWSGRLAARAAAARGSSPDEPTVPPTVDPTASPTAEPVEVRGGAGTSAEPVEAPAPDDALWLPRAVATPAPPPDGGPLALRLAEFEANEAWFANRALAHMPMFDPSVGFYQGRRPDGSFRFSPRDFDPRTWGRDYTETSAWGQAFHAPHDGAGLARLLGGEQALAAKLDEFLATPAITRPSMYGGYDYNIQEMNEAQAHGIGQLAISNQPAHHIPFMYLFCGQPHKTQWLTRELLDKKFVGSEIGQGYPGDEDNGEMSGYWLLLAMGLYPLFVGGGEWAVTAPLFRRMAFTRDDGTRLEVRASGIEHRYVQSLRVNGQPWKAVTIPGELLRGDVLLEFELGPEPSSWGAGTRPWSASTATGAQRTWQADRTREATLRGDAALVDDTGRGRVVLAPGEGVEFTWDQGFQPAYLTLTSPEADALPLRVQVRPSQGEQSGSWVDLALPPRRPLWQDQTIAHLLPTGEIDGLRLVATGRCVLSQVEVY